MNPTEQYFYDRDEQVKRNTTDKTLHIVSNAYMDHWHRTNYVKSFSWMGIPIMQLPQDLMAMQELIFKVQPVYIIETGIAFGGMTRFYHDMMSILWDTGMDVIAIDIDIRPHTKAVLKDLPATVIKGSSIDPKTVAKVREYIRKNEMYDSPCIVSLDSNHTHDHVYQELKLYSPLVSVGSYIVVFDTSIETLDPMYIGDRPWGRGNSPGSAVKQFLSETDEFVNDESIENRILLTSAPGGWLRRIK